MRAKSLLLLSACVPVGVLLSALAAQEGPPRRPGGRPRGATTRPVDDKPVRKDSTYRGPKVALKVRFTPGEYLLTDRREGRQVLRTHGQTRRNAQTMALAGEVVIHRGDSAGRRKLDLTCHSLRRTLSVDGKVRRYDSASSDPQDPALSAQWGPLAGWKGTRVVAATGRSEKLGGIDGLLLRLKPSVHLRPGEAERNLSQLAATLLGDLGVGGWAALIPTVPVAPGDEWRGELTLRGEPVLGEIRMTCNCLLQDIVQTGPRRRAAIDFVAVRRVDARGSDVRLASTPLAVGVKRMSLRLAGSIELDLGVGLATSVRTVLKGKGDMVIAHANGPATTVIQTVFESKWQRLLEPTKVE